MSILVDVESELPGSLDCTVDDDDDMRDTEADERGAPIDTFDDEGPSAEAAPMGLEFA